MSAMLTADWFPLGRDSYFRKFELYPLSFHFETSLDNLVVAAPYGGYIAITKNPNKFVKIKDSAKTVISLYNSAGNPMVKFQWTSGQLISMGWSHQEELLCVQQDGMVLIYDMFGVYQHAFCMGEEAKETKVVEAKFFQSMTGTGLAVLTSANRIFVVNNVTSPKVRQFTEVSKIISTITTWCAVRQDRDSQVLLANQDGIYQLKHFQPPVLTPFLKLFGNKINSVTHMVTSGNGQNLALYSDTGHLYLGSVDFREKYCECATNMKEPLTGMAWCGSEAVVCCWDRNLGVVGRTGETVFYNYDGPVHLVAEIDGVRIISAFSHEFVQKVPLVVQKIFKINSTDAASYLLEASKQFQKRSHKSDSYIDLIKDKLEIAVNDCINAASHEFGFETQKLLIQAAKFGKCFASNFDPDQYVNMCRMLRILNAVRHPNIGIPLTYVQLNALTYQVLFTFLNDNNSSYPTANYFLIF